jgi:indolepyruvate ferredoxin oxidoreductase
MNKAAVALGRLAAGNPEAVAKIVGVAKEVKPAAHDDAEELDALVARRERLLAGYQDAAYAARYRALVDTVRHAERRCAGPDGLLRVTAAVARNYAKLMAYKDEYEVARLYTNGEFRKQLEAQFEGDLSVQFHMAPPLLAKPGPHGENPRKMIFGGWMWRVLRVIAPMKALRASPFDVFGYALERRMERELIADYAATMTAVAAKLAPDNLANAEKVAAIPDRIRGYGQVKIANLRTAKRQEAELLRQLGVEQRIGDAVKRVLAGAPGAGGIGSIPVVTSR